MAKRGRWFSRGSDGGRRDVFLLQTEAGWQVIGRMGSSDWPEVIHYFDSAEEARAMVRLMSGDAPSPPPDESPAAAVAPAPEREGVNA